MRLKRQKNNRKTVKHYRMTHGFREPFKVLLDSTFVHVCSASDTVGELARAIPRLLGGKCRIFVTKHVGAELRRLGHHASASVARGFDLARGGDDVPRDASPADSIIALVGDANAEHYFVATQDKRLKAVLRGVAGTPLISATVNGLVLDEPPARETAAAAQDAGRTGAGGASGASVVSDAERERLKIQHPTLAGAVAKRGPRASAASKKAKGPNPLAAKKPASASKSKRAKPTARKDAARRAAAAAL